MALDWLRSSLAIPSEPAVEHIVVRLSAAIAFGMCVAGLHVWARPPHKPEGPRLGTSLVMLCVLISVVSQVVGDNAARAFSLVGALSVIRFRTPLEDTRDTAFVLFAVIEGMAAGVGYFEVALSGIAAGGLASMGFRMKNASAGAGVWQLDVRVANGKNVERLFENGIVGLIERMDFVSGSTVKSGSAMEYRYKVVLKPGITPLRLLAELGKNEDSLGCDIKQF